MSKKINVKVERVRQDEVRSLLDGYQRAYNVCGNAPHIDNLTVIVGRGATYFSLKSDSVDDLLDEVEMGGKSLCRTLVKQMYDLNEYQYLKIKHEFESTGNPSDKLATSGVFKKDGDYVVFFKMPDQEAWYNDERVQKASGTAAAVSGLGLGTVGYFVGRHYGRKQGPPQILAAEETVGKSSGPPARRGQAGALNSAERKPGSRGSGGGYEGGGYEGGGYAGY
jgi:hypothetical protein